MRNIKFRAHVDKDIIEGRPAEIYQVIKIDWDGEAPDDYITCAVLFSPKTMTFHTLEAKWFTLLEYTSRQTKDGKEIYEGDIVSAIYWSGKEHDDWVEKEMVAKVCWNEKTMSFILIENTKCKPQAFTWGRFNEDCFKILGSIYDIPEITPNPSP